MDVKEFIESGILEEYCLGLLSDEDQSFVIQMTVLYPEVKQELTLIEFAIENFAQANAIEPGDDTRQKILSAIYSTLPVNDVNFNNLPVIDRNSNPQSWLHAVEYLIPVVLEEDFFCRVLRQEARITQMLVITKTDVLPETHTDLIESFLILNGKCECTIGNDSFELDAGAFIEIPLHIEHDVKVLSPYVVAILQYLMV